MLPSIEEQLTQSFYKGFVDQFDKRSSKFKPRLLTNSTSENVLSTIHYELHKCKSFTFSVAFITEGGLAMLKTALYELNRRNIKGRILTSTFLQFNNPKMFNELLKIPNLEVRLSNEKGFHSKGYIFEHDKYFSLIVGSSNLTASALKTNYEWNIYLNSLENGEVIHHFTNQFEDAWKKATPLSLNWIREYASVYDASKNQGNSPAKELSVPYSVNVLKQSLLIQPNKMQQIALKQLRDLRNTGAKKGMIISATGTGKTYLSAFDVRNAQPKRMLFVVHREQILKKAMKDYQLILGGSDEDFGILSSGNKNIHAKYLFATIQTLAKDSTLLKFPVDHFDYILIDEVHRAGAESYLKLLNYFTPKFLLGMTATPERTDNFNVFELFDYNVAYEIRLQEALAEEMLCPFHYFGVTDYEYNGQFIDETSTLQQLISEERIEHLLEKVEYYGFSGDKLKGLIFCSSKIEAKELSTLLNNKNYHTTYLTGENSQEQREHAIQQLEDGHLDYILTVDIFNEGIDIPFINQIVMLRQTQSSIIFIQQLGRGLRKHANKDYVTIIDFIGNYKNNFLIPMALSGDKSFNKDNIRRKTVSTEYIQGVSTINFEEIAKSKIFEAINNTNLSTLKNLKDAFLEIKNRTNKIPMLYDFIQHHSVDPEVIIKYANNHYEFLQKLKEPIDFLPEDSLPVLNLFSKEFINGKRIHELVLIQLLLEKSYISKYEYIDKLKSFNTYFDESTLKSVERMFTLEFYVQNDIKKYGQKPLIQLTKNGYEWCHEIKSFIQLPLFRTFVEDIIKCGLTKSKIYNITSPLTVNMKYSRRDFCRLLNWESDCSSTIYGYRTKFDTTPLFVTYHKHDDVEATQQYGDEFISESIMQYYTRSRLTTESKEVKAITQHKSINNNIYLFVKKDDAEGTDFYYLGEVDVLSNTVANTFIPDKDGKNISIVTMQLELNSPVETSIYHYLTEK